MSIILDALKRAEALRKKSQPPNLMSGNLPSPRRNTRVLVLALLFVTAGLGAWLWRPSSPSASMLAQDAPQRPDGVVQAPQTEANTPSGIIQEQALIANEPVRSVQVSGGFVPVQAPKLDQTLTQSATAYPAQIRPALDQALTQPAVIRLAQENQPTTPAAKPTVGQQAVPSASDRPEAINLDASQPAPVQPVTPAPAELAPSLPTIFELDYPIRLALPKMLVSMYVYNSNPEFRFLIVNGKKVRQGEQVEATVTFTEIRRDGVECDYQGTRFFFPRTSL